MLLGLPSNGRCLQSHRLATGLYATIHFLPFTSIVLQIFIFLLSVILILSFILRFLFLFLFSLLPLWFFFLFLLPASPSVLIFPPFSLLLSSAFAFFPPWLTHVWRPLLIAFPPFFWAEHANPQNNVHRIGFLDAGHKSTRAQEHVSSSSSVVHSIRNVCGVHVNKASARGDSMITSYWSAGRGTTTRQSGYCGTAGASWTRLLIRLVGPLTFIYKHSTDIPNEVWKLHSHHVWKYSR
jgi:hypothetical protein